MADDAVPLLVIPMPARLPLVCALLDALGGAWEAEYGQPLTAANMAIRHSPWGPAMVIVETSESPEPMSDDERMMTSCASCCDKRPVPGTDFCTECQGERRD